MGTGLQKFTPPANTVLAANTSYFVVMSFTPSPGAGHPEWALTPSQAEDDDSFAGWSIYGTHHYRAAGQPGVWTPATVPGFIPLLLRVNRFQFRPHLLRQRRHRL